MTINIPDGGIIDEMYKKLATSFIARHSKIYPNWHFWFEIIPPGNTDLCMILDSETACA
jgi:hypothetical protein